MVHLHLTKKNQNICLHAAKRLLANGGVIAFPTETSYGLGCDPRNAKAVRRIFAIKGREKKKPLLLVASDLAQVRRVADLRPTSYAPASQHWPGPLSPVLPPTK